MPIRSEGNNSGIYRILLLIYESNSGGDSWQIEHNSTHLVGPDSLRSRQHFGGKGGGSNTGV